MHSKCGRHPATAATRKINPSVIRVATVIRTCRHILDSGPFCQAPAVGSGTYCRAHRLLRIRGRKIARARRRIPPVILPELIDARSVELGAARVREAIRGNRIDRQTGRAMFWALQLQHRIINLQQQLAVPRPTVAQSRHLNRSP